MDDDNKLVILENEKIRRKRLLPEMLLVLRGLINWAVRHSLSVFLANVKIRGVTQPEYQGLPMVGQDTESFTSWFTMEHRVDMGRVTYTVAIKVDRKKRSQRYYVDTPMVNQAGNWVKFKDFIIEAVEKNPITFRTDPEYYKAMVDWWEVPRPSTCVFDTEVLAIELHDMIQAFRRE